MKKLYEAPEVIETRFAVEDAITTTSPGGTGLPDNGIVLPDDEWE